MTLGEIYAVANAKLSNNGMSDDVKEELYQDFMAGKNDDA